VNVEIAQDSQNNRHLLAIDERLGLPVHESSRRRAGYTKGLFQTAQPPAEPTLDLAAPRL